MDVTNERVRRHRTRLRAQGLRPVQIWVPDVRAAGFAAAAHEQSVAVATSDAADDDQAFVDAVSEDWAAADDADERRDAGRGTEGPTQEARGGK